MKRVLTYNGLTLDQMSKTDLLCRLRKNRERLRTRFLVLNVMGVAATLTHPLAGVYTLIVCAVTSYWLMQNNRAIEEEIAARR